MNVFTRRLGKRFNTKRLRLCYFNSHIFKINIAKYSISQKKLPRKMRASKFDRFVARGPKWLKKPYIKLRFVLFRHDRFVRAIAGSLAVIIIFGLGIEFYTAIYPQQAYKISSNAEVLLDKTTQLYATKLQADTNSANLVYNAGYTPSNEITGQIAGPKFSATFANNPSDGHTITDPLYGTSVTFKPKFKLDSPIKQDNRVIYPLSGGNGAKVLTLKAGSVKEDIILEKPQQDSLTYEYEINIDESMEVRQEGDGSLGIYGIDNVALLGKVSTSSENDAQLLQKARQNGDKTKLIYRIPAPFIKETGGSRSDATAWYSLSGSTLSIHTANLNQANYPISIDPTVYIETATKFMQGNNETNIDFDPTNELIQKSQTTGARIDGWVSSVDMSSGVWNHAVATAGGYVYRAGGKVDSTMPYISGQQASNQATDSTTFTMNMPTSRPAGDLYVAIIAHDGSITVTPPAGGGWTEIADNDLAGGSTGELAAYYKIGTNQGGGNEATNYTWTGSGAEQWVGVILRIKGFDSANPIACTTIPTCLGRSSDTAAPFVPITMPAVTPNTNASLVLRAVAINEDDPSEYTWLPSGHTKVYAGTSLFGSSNNNSAGLVTMTLDQPPLSTNTTGTATLVQDGILNNSYGAISVPIKPALVTSGYQNILEWAQFDNNSSDIISPNPGTGACNGWCTNSAYNLPANRVGMSMVSYNGYLYALGGTPDGNPLNNSNTVWVAKLGANGEPQLWHPTGGTPGYWFVSTRTLPVSIAYSSVATYKNRLYLVGGQSSAGASLNTVYYADLLPNGEIGSWSTTGMQDLTTPTARFGHSIHIYNDVMYILGGNNNGTLRNSVFYSKLNNDGSMNPWTTTNNFATGRSTFGGTFSAVWGAYIYISGGCTSLSGGYCSNIASDVQLASINADGSLSPWNSIATLSNQRIGYNFVAWQGGLYRLGGCNRQNTTTGECYATYQDVEFGAVNPPGDASTVSNSEPSGTAPCSGSSPVNCDLPPAGDGAGQGGQMSSMVVVNNGFIYNIGGCVNGASTCSTDMSGNISYAAINSLGQMVAPANCPSPNTSYGLWCIDSTNRINGTSGLGAAGVSVFNNTIYIAGGTNASAWQSTIFRVLLNADGSLSGAWQTQTFASVGAGSARGYMYMFARANPSAVATNPGNLYMLGGCTGSGGIGCNSYFTDTVKCNIQINGSIAGCSTAGQMQIDADNIATGNQGLSLMAGTVYANRLYLVGGACGVVGAPGNPCGSTYAANRKDTIYALIDSNNNIVDVDNGQANGTWNFSTAQMNPVRRRAVAFGYNGYIYSLAGYSGLASLQDLLFSKINVSTGDLSPWESSGVVVTPRWDLRAVVSNGYVYAIGGCGAGAAPTGCTSMQPEVQTFQLYNNDSGTPISFGASANQFANDRIGASSTVMNGVLYVAGGCTGVTECASVTNSVQYATIDTYGNLSNWSTGNNLPEARAWGQLESAGGTLYYIAGRNTAGTNQASIYYSSLVSSGNPTWSTASNSLPVALQQFSADSWDGRLYVTGGINASGALQNTVYYSPKLSSSVSAGDITSAWTASTTFITARSGHSTLVYANNIYVIGGYDGTNYLSDVQYASLGYKNGTIAQSGNTIIGSGTNWTNSMIGATLQYRDGEIATILSVPSATSMTVTVSKNVTVGTGYTILDGSVGSWSYSTSLPEPIRQADVFAINGYMYLVGGRSSDGDCVPNVLQAPISANTTINSGNNPTGIGEWYETNVKYSGDRYGNSVSYYGGKMYVTGGACEKWPTVSSVTSQAFNIDTTAHDVTMPSVVDPGDLLIVLFSNDGDATINDPDGAGPWTSKSTLTRGTNIRGSVWAIDAIGTEDGTTVPFTTTSAEQASAIVYRIPESKWHGDINSVEATAFGPGSATSNPNPPNLDPVGWGTENTLWLTYVAGSAYSAVTTYPTNHTNGLHVGSTGGITTDRATTSTSRIESRSANIDPDTYTMSGVASDGVAFTIAIRPAPFAYTGANRTTQSAVYSQPQVASYSRMIDTDTDVFPTKWLMNGLDNSIGARWQMRYRTMHDTSDGVGQQNPSEDCGTSTTMPIMTTWGQETNFGDVTLGQPESYTAKNSSGGNINCARYYYFYVSIDASKTFGYPEDVNRGPTINDLSLFFTSDPSKRMRHGKTFTGGQQQPLDSPF